MEWRQVDNKHYSGRYTIIENPPGVNGGRVRVTWRSGLLGVICAEGVDRAKRLCEVHQELMRDA